MNIKQTGMDFTGIKMSISGNKTEKEGTHQWTEYIINVELPGSAWTVSRRFSAIESLHQSFLKV